MVRVTTDSECDETHRRVEKRIQSMVQLSWGILNAKPKCTEANFKSIRRHAGHAVESMGLLTGRYLQNGMVPRGVQGQVWRCLSTKAGWANGLLTRSKYIELVNKLIMRNGWSISSWLVMLFYLEFSFVKKSGAPGALPTQVTCLEILIRNHFRAHVTCWIFDCLAMCFDSFFVDCSHHPCQSAISLPFFFVCGELFLSALRTFSTLKILDPKSPDTKQRN